MPSQNPLKPRKKPKQSRSRFTVDSLVEATIQVLEKEGYEKLNTIKVAERAGVGVGSLYQYFSNKREMFSEVVERRMQEKKERVESKMDSFSNLTPLEQITRQMLESILAFYAEHAKLECTALKEGFLAEKKKTMGEVRRTAIELFKKSFLECTLGTPIPPNLDLALFIVVYAVEGVLEGILLEKPELLVQEVLLEELAALVVKYLRP